MEDFNSISNLILNSDDINIRGWKEMHSFLKAIIHGCSSSSEEYGAMVTGSSVEGSKLYQPDDPGDFDVMVYSKVQKDIVRVDDLVNIEKYPGFVKIKKDNDDHLTVTTVLTTWPQLLTELFNIFNSMVVTEKLNFEYKSFGVRYLIEAHNSLPPLETQCQEIPKLAETDKVFLENLFSLIFRDREFHNKFEEALALTESAEIQDLTDFYTTGFQMLAIFAKENVFGTDSSNGSLNVTEIMKPNHNEEDEVNHDFRRNIAVEPTCIQNTVLEETSDLLLSSAEENQCQATVSVLGSTDQEKTNKSDLSTPEKPDTTNSFAPSYYQESNENNVHCNSEKFNKVLQNIMYQMTVKKARESVAVLVDSKKVDTSSSMQVDSIHKRQRNEEARTFSMDLVWAIRIDGWPSVAKDWVCRKRKWPSKDLVNEIRYSSKIFSVIKHPEDMTDIDEIKNTFRLSFSHPELMLFESMNDTQIGCYRLMKALKTVYFKLATKKFSSYHIKTLLFWAIENNEDIWVTEMLQDCLLLMLANLLDALDEKVLSHYFIQNLNLFADFSSVEIASLLADVTSILENPLAALNKANYEFQEKSKSVLRKTTRDMKGSEETARGAHIPSPVNDPYTTFPKRYSEEYDKITEEFVEEISREFSQEGFQVVFSEDLKKAFKTCVADGIMTINSIRSMFKYLKRFMFEKHSLNMNDGRRDTKQVILEDINFVSKFTNYIVQSDEMTVDHIMNSLISGFENEDPTSIDILEGLLPDMNEVLRSFSEVIFK